MKSIFSLFFIKVSILSFVLTSCGEGSGNREQRGSEAWSSRRQTNSVEVAEISTSSISDLIRSYGTVQAQDIVTIIPQVSDRIISIHADLGDTVHQDEVLAKIYEVPFRDALEQARAQLRQSQSTFHRDSLAFERQRQLYERGAGSKSEYDDAFMAFSNSRAQYESARAALTQSRENLSNTEVRSPVDGVVLRRSLSEGDLARTGEPVFEIANLAGLEVRLHLPMLDWDAVRIGHPVEMRFSNSNTIVAGGMVSRISPQLDPTTGLGEVVISLNDASSMVRQGALVDARITLKTHEETIVIPRSAMIEKADTYIRPETNTVEIRKSYVAFVAIGDTIAEQRPLDLGLQDGERVEVISGLYEGDRLIITGQRSLSDRERIRIAGQDKKSDREQYLEEDHSRGRSGEVFGKSPDGQGSGSGDGGGGGKRRNSSPRGSGG